jgi:hypothetical protein
VALSFDEFCSRLEHLRLDRCHSPGSWGHPSPSTWDRGETRATALLIA